jgi:hypothetical protein
MANDIRTAPATELLRLRTVLTYTLETIERMIPGVEQLAGVYALRDVGYGRLADELKSALADHEMGTPATIAKVLAEVLGETP